jgi:hypothetical protein
MVEAKAIVGLIPISVQTDNNNVKWLVFKYEGYAPKGWPKYVEYDGKHFFNTGYNSDRGIIYYKECATIQVAREIKK